MKELSFDEGKAKELYDQGLRDSEIADRLNVKSTLIGSWRYRRGMPANLPPLKGGTKPEVTVDIPAGIGGDGDPPRTSPLPDSERADLRQRDGPDLPPPGGDGAFPLDISFSIADFSVSLRASNYRNALAAAELLMAAVKAAGSVSIADAKQ